MRQKHNIDDILENGIELLREKGYNNTGVEEILKINNIPKGSFYNFFESKEDFALKALDKYVQKQFSYIVSLLGNRSISPLERLKKFYLEMIEFNSNEDCSKGCLLANLTQELGGSNPKFSDAGKKHYEKIGSLIAACIAEGQMLGEITDKFESSQLACFLHNSFNGAVLRSKAGHTTNPMVTYMDIMFELIKK